MTDEFYMLSLSLPVLLSDSRETRNDVAHTEAWRTLRTPLCAEMHSALQHHERKLKQGGEMESNKLGNKFDGKKGHTCLKKERLIIPVEFLKSGQGISHTWHKVQMGTPSKTSHIQPQICLGTTAKQESSWQRDSHSFPTSPVRAPEH